jgi:hypothetical protein
MPTVYLKGGETAQVSLENLEDYLYDNAERIETRRKQLKRPSADSAITSTSSK